MAWQELTRVKIWNWKTSQAVTWAKALSVHTKAGMKFGNSRLITWFFTLAVDCTLKAFCFSLNPVPFKIRTYSWSQETALSLAVQLNLGFFPELLPSAHLLLLGYKTGPCYFFLKVTWEVWIHPMQDSIYAITMRWWTVSWSVLGSQELTRKQTWGIISFIHEEVITQIVRQNLSNFNNNGVDIIEITESN